MEHSLEEEENSDSGKAEGSMALVQYCNELEVCTVYCEDNKF